MIKDDELYLVKRNNFIQEYKIKNLSLVEIRIINYLIANIHSPKFDKEFRRFRFSVKEFCDVVYPDSIPGKRYDVLPDVIKKLSDKSAWKEIPSTENPGKMKTVLIRWIERPEFEPGYVTLELNPYLAPYLLQVDQSFFEAKFQYTALAQSKYTIPLYELLKSWEKTKGGVKRFEVMELRTYMDALEKSKDNIAEFKRRALNIAVKEINEITDLEVSYQEIKKGKKVTHIEFKITKKHEESALRIEEQKQNSLSDPEEWFVDDGKEFSGQLNLLDALPKENDPPSKAQPGITEQRIKKIADSLRPLVNEINPDWKISDKKLVALNDKVHMHLIETLGYDRGSLAKPDQIDRMKYDILRKILSEANTEGAYAPYGWILKAWDTVIERAEVEKIIYVHMD